MLIDLTNKDAWIIASWLIACITAFANFELRFKAALNKKSWTDGVAGFFWLLGFIAFAYRVGLVIKGGA